jgi:hypothetical protein
VTHQVPDAHRIRLHEQLSVTTYYCPASGTLLAVDVHERGGRPIDDVLVDPSLLLDQKSSPSRQTEAAH